MADNYDNENGRRGKGILFVLSSPSGGGKTTLAHRLLDSVADLGLSISHTTRAPRKGEKDGVDYHFVSRDQFQVKIKGNQFVEWAEVHSNLYGTSHDSIDAIVSGGLDVLLDIDVQGGVQIRDRFPGSILIFTCRRPTRSGWSDCGPGGPRQTWNCSAGSTPPGKSVLQ